MKIRKYHLYLADLNPRIGTEPGKTRPVVVLQTDLLNEAHCSTIVCPVTTNVVMEASILRVHLGENEAGLKKKSDILVDRIRAIDNRRFIKEIGVLSPQLREQLVRNVKIVLFE
jgi:mRNA interferase MazF